MDAEAVAACIDVGVGGEVTLAIGGRHDDLHGPPVEVTGKVRLIHAGSFVLAGPMEGGTLASRGRTVVLEIGGRNGIEVQLTELRGHPRDLNHFRAAFEPIATEIIEVDAPGISSRKLVTFDYQHLRRPIYPLDTDVIWAPS